MKSPLFWALGLGSLFTGLYAVFCEEMYRDVSGRYAPMARAFANSDFAAAFDAAYSPLAPALGGLIAFVCGIEPYSALMLATGLFYVLAVIPLYFSLRLLLRDAKLAAWGCLLYVIAPKIIRISCMGCLESARNFMLISAMACLLGFSRERRLWLMPLFGLSLAGLCLARSECVAYVPFFFALAAFSCLRADGFKFDVASFARGCILPLGLAFVCMALALLPRLVQVALQEGFPALDSSQASFAFHLLGRNGYESLSAIATGIDASQRADGSFSFSRLAQWLACLANGSYPLYFGLAFLGVCLMIRAKRFEFELAIPLLLALYGALLYLLLNLSPRYFNANVALLMPFTVYALFRLFELIPARRRIFFWLVAAAIASFQVANGVGEAFSRENKGYKEAGLWLKANASRLSSSVDGLNGSFAIASSDSAVNYWAEAPQVHLDKNADSLEGLAFPDSVYVVIKRGRARLIESFERDEAFFRVAWPGDARVAIFAKRF